MSEIRHVIFKAVPAEQLEGDRLLRVEINGDTLTLRLDQAEINRALCEQLTEYHQDIVGTLIVQADVPVNGVAPDGGRVITESRYEFVPKRALPRGRLCWPVDSLNEFIWQVPYKSMSEEMRRAINAFIAAQLATHRWLQH